MNTKYTRFVLAAVIYAVFAGYLYRPYFDGFGSPRPQDLFVMNVSLASLGTYVLSRRWMAGFAESFFAGAVYGFGPYVLGLVKFHPTGVFLAAAIPWLFCPAAFGPKMRRQRAEGTPFCKKNRKMGTQARGQRSVFRPLSSVLYVLSSVFRLPSSVLCLLPFLVIVLFFQLAGSFGLYPIPVGAVREPPLLALLAPLVAAKRQKMLIGFYHVPLAALVMGLCMFLAPFCLVSRASCPRFEGGTPSTQKAKQGSMLQKGKVLRDLAFRRLGIVSIFAVATVLAFCDSLLQVSPIIWLSISTLCCSVLIGLGMQGLISAGATDRNPILFTAVLMGVLAIITLLFATDCFQIAIGLGASYGRLLTETAKMYILAAAAVAMIFLITRAKLRLHAVRRLLLCAAVALDIFLGARFIVDTIL